MAMYSRAFRHIGAAKRAAARQRHRTHTGETPMDAFTITVTPQHLHDGWALVLEHSLHTGELVTVSVMTREQADRLPAETELSEFVVKTLGNVLAREAPGCFAPNKAQAILTFDARTGRVKTIA